MKKNFVRLVLAIAVVTVSTVAYAKLSKNDVKKTAQAEAVKAAAGVKTACGCNVAINYTWGDFDTMTTNAHDDEAKPRSWQTNFVAEAHGVQGAAETLCKDADLKKKFCAIKKVTIIGKGVSETDFKYGPASGVEIYTSEQMQLGSIITDRVKDAIDN